MKRTIFYIFAIAAFLWMLPGKAGAQILDRGLSLSNMPSFTQKGTWMVGGTGSWTVHRNDNYSFIFSDRMTSTGYNVKVSPAFCYMLKDNLGIGVRAGYSRSNLKVDEANIGFGDLGMDISDIHTLKHHYEINALMRNYIPIGKSRKLALYNEIQMGYRFGVSKIAGRMEEGYNGNYTDDRSIQVNFCPGIVGFANDHWAVDVNVNMLGLTLANMKQSQNQVEKGSLNVTKMSFQVNILAIGFGLYYYL